MARNFRIKSRINGDSLYLMLNGDFDGTSALELIYALKEKIGWTGKIYIEADGLSNLFPFGREVFQKHFCFSLRDCRKMTFLGNAGGRIAPPRTGCVESRIG